MLLQDLKKGGVVSSRGLQSPYATISCDDENFEIEGLLEVSVKCSGLDDFDVDALVLFFYGVDQDGNIEAELEACYASEPCTQTGCYASSNFAATKIEWKCESTFGEVQVEFKSKVVV